MFGNRLQLHDGRAIEKGNALQAVERGHRRARTRVDENRFAGECTLTAVFQSDAHRLRAGEAGIAADQLECGGPFDTSLNAAAKAGHDVALALPDAFHVGEDTSYVNAVANAPPREMRHAPTRDHGFR